MDSGLALRAPWNDSSKQAHQEAQRYREQKNAEGDFELAARQPMRQMRAIRRDVARDRSSHRKSNQRHKAERERRQLGLMRQAGNTKPMAPAIVIGTATPDEVATALWIGLP